MNVLIYLSLMVSLMAPEFSFSIYWDVLIKFKYGASLQVDCLKAYDFQTGRFEITRGVNLPVKGISF